MFSSHLFLQCFAKTVNGDSVRVLLVVGGTEVEGDSRGPGEQGGHLCFLGVHSSSNSSFPLL